MSRWIHCKNFKSNGIVHCEIPVCKHGARSSDLQRCESSKCNTILHRMKPQCNRDTRTVVCSVWTTMHESVIHYTQLFVYLHCTTVPHSVKSYYTSNFHSTVRLNHVLYVCVLVSHDVLYHLTWNFYSVSIYSKLSSPGNLVSFFSFMAVYKFRGTYLWDDPRITNQLTPQFFSIINTYIKKTAYLLA